MVFFFRFGSVSSSKAHLMNSLINEKHHTFFHRNCPGSSRTRVLMDGVVEIAWFCPSGKYDDKFTHCVAFCNLHGDARDHEKQLQILIEMTSVNVVLLPQLDRSHKSAKTIQKLYKQRKPLICLLAEDESTVIETKKGKHKIGLKNRNQSEVSEELRRTINDCLTESASTFRLEDVSKHSDIRVDEEDDDDCRRGREAAQQMMSLLKNKHLTEIKESFLPHQGKLWHQWCQKNKELHRPQAHETEMDISRKQTEVKIIRQQQHESDISAFIKLFINELNSHDANKKMYFLKWLRILLDEHTSDDLSALHHKYDEKWSVVVKLTENHAKSEKLMAEQTDLEKISEELQAATFGLEHIMREIGQIYESCSSVKENKKDLQFDFSSLPSLAAEMMISGFPLELMDGDAAHVPVIWISAVLDQLIQKLGDQRVFVLSVLGIQSSGKSTMLSVMFGLQFAVSAGRCTRGAFMQLVRVSDEMKTQMNFDYILVVDTEGLGALELAGRSTRRHDNELATFAVGLGNLTLINIFGENPSEMQDILQIVVQAFMRMKKVRLNPSCVFVHQNVSDVTAGEKNMEGRRRRIFFSALGGQPTNGTTKPKLLAMIETENKLHNKIENEAIHEVEETDLKKELKNTNVQENIVTETKKKLNEILKQRHLKKKIDAQRTQHENTLFEKSKELALKLKNKANEETLKKEFDLFWEQSVEKIIKDTLTIKDIDIMRDVKLLLSDVYESASACHWNDSRDIFSVFSYSEYVQLKKSSRFTFYRAAKEILGYSLSEEDEAQIRTFVTDVAQQTDRMIQSYRFSKMGYNISYIQLLTDYIMQRVTEHQAGPVNYVFKNEFFMDLILSLFKKANKTITDQHRMFREANDPVIYVEKKREEYYCIFQKYCQGATSAAIFGEIICQKLKEPIEQCVYKKTARDLAGEMRTDCESMMENRSNLEKHILKTLAEEEDFNKYINYIHNPKDHFKSFIRDEVSRYITDKFSISVSPIRKENIKLLQQKIMKAAHGSTEHVQVNSGDVGLWLKCFTQKLSDELIFSEKDLSGVKHDVDFNLLLDVIKQELPAIIAVGFPYKQYRKAGGVYAKWSITPDLSELPYWKWFVCRFQEDLENHYDKTFENSGNIPDEWRKFTKQDAIESLDK
ncbi:Interferon-induced very large GTPase 1 [Labeo rohita]|uniref:Interferon-induced very large GTPase 1 n=1 Tax=Labeo rohita TaxID=84645 RepID=A0ABQ8MVX1_LABRO|nr:Interferon-induced very large GTPase 1 [Labeo rohita]